MKRLVICCDGTWNRPDQHNGGVTAPTNVVRLHNCVAAQDGAGVGQRRYYHPGIGTDPVGAVRRLIAGATGIGLDRNIKSAYRELSDHYQPGDEIFLFGFSRGAFTVRSLAGMVWHCGLLDTAGLTDAQAWQRVDRAFDDGYRQRRRHWADGLGWAFHRSDRDDGAIPIRFIGVWDTVGALGVPEDLAFFGLLTGPADHAFHNTGLGGHIQTARHALALDEKRASFLPTLWTGVDAGRDVVQMWFCGCHADVGGGYRESGLADIALHWMIGEAAGAGLAFDPAMVARVDATQFDAPLHDSATGGFSWLAAMPRATPDLNRAIGLHPAVGLRRRVPPVTQAPYRPAGTLGEPVAIYADQSWNDTGLYLEAGTTYTLTADGEWLDDAVPCGPDGPTGPVWRLGRLAQGLSSLAGKVEERYKAWRGKPRLNVPFTKRHEQWPWFCLVGAIASGGVDQAGVLLPHETFRIGAGPVTVTPRASGYLYAYANDAWGMYGNNRGRVRLTVV